MNHFSAYVREVPGGWWAMLRFARDGKPKPVMGEGDKPKVLPTKLEATEEALKHLLAYMNTEYLRCGETASAARTEAEKLFPSLQPSFAGSAKAMPSNTSGASVTRANQPRTWKKQLGIRTVWSKP